MKHSQRIHTEEKCSTSKRWMCEDVFLIKMFRVHIYCCLWFLTLTGFFQTMDQIPVQITWNKESSTEYLCDCPYLNVNSNVLFS